MKRGLSLTFVALVVTMGALAVPCVSWYAVGMRDAERRAAALEEQERRSARETVIRLAERIRTRLETLREAESQRPFYHYQNFYHDPKGAYEGASVIPSPLAQGPVDPLIEAHFQIDPTGTLTLPTLNEEVEQVGNQEEIAAQRAIKNRLNAAAAACLSLVRQTPVPQQTLASTRTSVPQSQGVQNKLTQPDLHEPQQVAQSSPKQKVEILESAAWQQNVQASKLYSDIKGGKRSVSEQREYQQPARKKGGEIIRVGVNDFQWHTVRLENIPRLVGLRKVTTPQGEFVQGFVVSSAAISESLVGAAFPARFAKETRAGEDEIGLAVSGTGWRVLVDARRAVAEGRARAEGVKTRFVQFFLGGVAAAAVAGLCVVGLVWQTERLARQRSQFAASAAHELRTPLAGLRMYSEMLAEGLGDPTRAREYARRVAEEAERLGRVVANMLGFTRLERGTLKVRPVPGDLGAAVHECVDRQRPAIEAMGARVETMIAESLPQVRFDRDAVDEILQNLIDNAEKHTRSAANRTIEVSVSVAANGVAVAVADHGPGVPAETRRRLFRPFERGNHADAPAGLGLGLVLVQALTKAHGGKVSYADATGGGAEFTVTFPA